MAHDMAKMICAIDPGLKYCSSGMDVVSACRAEGVSDKPIMVGAVSMAE